MFNMHIPASLHLLLAACTGAPAAARSLGLHIADLLDLFHGSPNIEVLADCQSILYLQVPAPDARIRLLDGRAPEELPVGSEPDE